MLVDVIREAKEEDGKVICIGLLQPARSRMFLLLAGFPPYLVHSRHSINICFMEEWLNGTTLPARGEIRRKLPIVPSQWSLFFPP